MFRGNHPARVDEKGRLKLPAAFKARVDEQYGPAFFITSKDGKRAEVFPMQEWEKIEAAIVAMPSSPAKKRFLDVTNYYGQVVEMDGQGRVLIPQLLRESAALNGDAAVLGLQTYLAVVNDERQRSALAEDPLTDADIAALGVVGI